MFSAKPEKIMFRFDESMIFTKLYVAPWEVPTAGKHPENVFFLTKVGTLRKALGMPWQVLGAPWVDCLGDPPLSLS